MSFLHPLDPATAEEITFATSIVKRAFDGIELHFKAGGLQEPVKSDLVAYLDAEHNGQPLPDLPRCIFLMWYIKRTPRLFEAIVDVTNGKIIHQLELPRDFHGPVDRTELGEAANVVMADPNVQRELKRLKIDDTTVVLDPWDYGVDGEETQERHTQVGCVLQCLIWRQKEYTHTDSLLLYRFSCISETPKITTQIRITMLSPSTLWSLSIFVL